MVGGIANGLGLATLSTSFRARSCAATRQQEKNKRAIDPT